MDELENCLGQTILAIVLHFEEAEAIDLALDAPYVRIDFPPILRYSIPTSGTHD